MEQPLQFMPDQKIVSSKQASRTTNQQLDATRAGSWKRKCFQTCASIFSPLAHAVHFIAQDNLQIILDASGYFYGEPWPLSWMEDRISLYQSLHAQGLQIILLPQALGPFSRSDYRSAFLQLANIADRIYARDETSRQHALDCGTPPHIVHSYSDFTNSLEPYVSPRARSLAGQACVVPNMRLIDKTPQEVGARYVDYLIDCIKLLSRSRVAVCLVLFEKDDIQLAKLIQGKVDFKTEVVASENPLELKGILSLSHLVIASRYHAIASSLALAIPTLCIGWSHKYEHLMSDYESSHCSIDFREVLEGDVSKLSMLMQARDQESARLKLVGVKQKLRTELFWQEIHKQIS